MLTAGAVRRAAKATLQLWMPSVLNEVLRQEDRAVIATAKQVRTWKGVNDVRNLPDDQLPAVIITSPGILRGEDDGDGIFTADWSLYVGAYLRGKDYEDTADLVGIYAAAVRTSLAQHGDLGGFADGTAWVPEEEEYELIDPTASRTLGGALLGFVVTTNEVLDINAGAATPPVDPQDEPTDPPEAETVKVVEPPLIL